MKHVRTTLKITFAILLIVSVLVGCVSMEASTEAAALNPANNETIAPANDDNEDVTAPEALAPSTTPTEPTQTNPIPTEPVFPTEPTPTEPKPTVHTHSYTETVTEPTCAELGFTTYACACGHFYQENEVPATGHNWGDWMIVREATEGETGAEERICDECLKVEKREISKLEHTHHYEAEVTQRPTCEAAGVKTYACRCGDNYTETIAKLKHSYTGMVAKQATCAEPGVKTFNCSCGDSYTEAIAQLEHSYTEKITKPTCTKKGYTTHTCACGDSYKDSHKNATGHNWSEWGTVKEPTEQAEGEAKRTCGKCSASETKTLDKLEHQYPLAYSDETATITITKEWYENAWCYIAHLQFTDYARLSTACANGKYRGGYETTSHAAKRLNAIFAVNGCYSAPKLNYTVVRNGVIWNGSGRNLWVPAVYSARTGMLLSAWETNGTPGIAGKPVDELVANGLVTDTFCFGPPVLTGGNIVVKAGGSRAQRTFIGTSGNPGEIWVVVSEGRKVDDESDGLTGYQCASLLQEKGCTFGVCLDGGGSCTMVFQGRVLNSAKGKERAVVDFLIFK